MSAKVTVEKRSLQFVWVDGTASHVLSWRWQSNPDKANTLGCCLVLERRLDLFGRILVEPAYIAWGRWVRRRSW